MEMNVTRLFPTFMRTSLFKTLLITGITLSSGMIFAQIVPTPGTPGTSTGSTNAPVIPEAGPVGTGSTTAQNVVPKPDSRPLTPQEVFKLFEVNQDNRLDEGEYVRAAAFSAEAAAGTIIIPGTNVNPGTHSSGTAPIPNADPNRNNSGADGR